MSISTLSPKDRELLSILSENAREQTAAIARRLGLSRTTVQAKIERLERDGVIAGYRADVSAERLGLGLQAFVRVQLKHHDSAAVAGFAELVNGWDEVIACHALTGDMDYLLQIAVRDLEHFSGFLLDRLLNQPAVDDVNSSFVLRTVKAWRGLPLPN